MIRREAIRRAAGSFAVARLPTPALDAAVLLGHTLGIPSEQVLLEREAPLRPEEEERFLALVSGRLTRVPVSQLLGRREFFGLDFMVSRDVLTPRPETEVLVEAALEALTRCPGDSRGRLPSVLDLGTGSGCIAVALAIHAPCRVTAVDVSAPALAVAAGNARAHGVSSRIRFLLSDLDGALSPASRFDLVVSNPPYIPDGDLAGLEPEVAVHEPAIALAGGADGMDFHRRILSTCARRLLPGGELLLEAGWGQADALARMMEQAGLRRVGILPDLSGIGRVVRGTTQGDPRG